MARMRGTLGKARKPLAIVAGVALLAVGAYVVNDRVLSDDEGQAGPRPVALEVRVLRPGTFASAHPYAPYYVVPVKRFASPSDLSRVSRNKIVTQPESALQKGALAGSPQIVRLQLRTTSQDPIAVDAVNVTVVSDARPLRGWFTAAAACEFEGVPRATFDVDRRRPRVRYRDGAGKRARGPGIVVSRSSGPAVLELQATANRSRVAWTAELEVRPQDSDDDVQTITVDDRGEPFRVTATRAARYYRPIYGASGIIGYARQGDFDGRC